MCSALYCSAAVHGPTIMPSDADLALLLRGDHG